MKLKRETIDSCFYILYQSSYKCSAYLWNYLDAVKASSKRRQEQFFPEMDEAAVWGWSPVWPDWAIFESSWL